MTPAVQTPNPTPLESLDEWEDDVLARYPEPTEYDAGKPKDQFRNYEEPPRSTVREFYRLNHTHQTLAYVKEKRAQYEPGMHGKRSIWEMMEFLNNLVDDSDPDTSMTQIQHLLQTAEGIRKDGHPRWFILTGLVHDLGKVLCLWGEPQWGVVGDTFPMGCKFSDKIVFSEFFEANPDNTNPELNTELGIYEPNCGLENILISWGHDEYMYRVAKPYLPKEGLAMIRYHSLYPVHREGAYANLMTPEDEAMMKWVKAFNNYDLYTKSDAPPNVDELRPFYEELINEFFPAEIEW